MLKLKEKPFKKISLILDNQLNHDFLTMTFPNLEQNSISSIK